MPGNHVTLWFTSLSHNRVGLAQILIGMQEGGERHGRVPAHLGKGRTPVRGLGDNDDFFLCGSRRVQGAKQGLREFSTDLRVERVLKNPAE